MQKYETSYLFVKCRAPYFARRETGGESGIII